MKQFAYVVFLLLLLLSACQRGVRVTGELAMLDSLVDVDCDSALSVLVQLDTRKMEKGEQIQEQYIYRNMLIYNPLEGCYTVVE